MSAKSAELELVDRMTWKLIDTAPDLRPILLREGVNVYKGLFDSEVCCWHSFCGQPVTYEPEPDAWMELPPGTEE